MPMNISNNSLIASIARIKKTHRYNIPHSNLRTITCKVVEPPPDFFSFFLLPSSLPQVNAAMPQTGCQITRAISIRYKSRLHQMI